MKRLALLPLLLLGCGDLSTNAADPLSPGASLPPGASPTAGPVEPPPEVVEPTPLPFDAVCASGSWTRPEQPAFWIGGPGSLDLVNASGERRNLLVVDRPAGVPPEVDVFHEIEAEVRGEYIAVAARWAWWSQLSRETTIGTELFLLNLDGDVLASLSIPDILSATLYLADDGTMTWAAGPAESIEFGGVLGGALLAPDGTALRLSEVTPIGPAIDGRWVPGCETTGRLCNWLDVLDDVSAPSYGWHTGNDDAAFDAEVLRVDGCAITNEGPGSLEQVDITPFAPDGGCGRARLLAQNDEGWVVVGEYDFERNADPIPWVRYHRGTGEVVPVALDWPDDFAPLPRDFCFASDWSLTSDGALLFPMRNRWMAQVMRAQWDGDAWRWSPVGAPVAGAIHIRATEQGGTVQILAEDHEMTFCPPGDYDAPPAGSEVELLEGTSFQLLRGDIPVRVDRRGERGTWDVQPFVNVTPDGRCALLRRDRVDFSDTDLYLLDIVTGEESLVMPNAGFSSGWAR